MESFAPMITMLERTTRETDLAPCYFRVWWHYKGTSFYKCCLCSRHIEDWNDLQEHKTQVGHRRQQEQFQSTFQRAASMLRNYDDCQEQQALDRLELLGSPAWKDAVRAALFSHLIADCPKGLLTKAMHTLVKYEQRERLALLELAIWKDLCLQKMPDSDYSKAVEWMKSGWKTLKQELRNSSAIVTVVSLVRPYIQTLV
jgi:hypothetical protein